MWLFFIGVYGEELSHEKFTFIFILFFNKTQILNTIDNEKCTGKLNSYQCADERPSRVGGLALNSLIRKIWNRINLSCVVWSISLKSFFVPYQFLVSIMMPQNTIHCKHYHLCTVKENLNMTFSPVSHKKL